VQAKQFGARQAVATQVTRLTFDNAYNVKRRRTEPRRGPRVADRYNASSDGLARR
jgi:hypothetical protein